MKLLRTSVGYGSLLTLVFVFFTDCTLGIPKKSPSSFRLFVIRHAQAYKNIVTPEDEFSKEKLDSLTPEGIAQAKATGQFLKDRGIHVWISSPTGRAIQTRDIIYSMSNSKGTLFVDDAFSSIKKGRDENGNQTTWDWRIENWNRDMDPTPEGGESFQDASVRIVTAINDLNNKYKGKNVAIITHSDVCAAIIGHTLKTPITQQYSNHTIGLGAFNEIEISHTNTWSLTSMVNK